jgi:hypothetical protein
LDQLTEADLRDWCGRFFTKENAVVWFAGVDEAPEVRLALPHGVRQPTPAVRSILPQTPAWTWAPEGGSAAQFIVKRSRAATLFASVLGRRAYARLRQEAGLSYAPSVSYQSLDADLAEITLLADHRPEQSAAACKEFLAVISEVCHGGITQSDIDDYMEPPPPEARTPEKMARTEASRIGNHAYDLLVGAPIQRAEDILTESAPTLQEVREITDQAWNSMLLVVPESAGAPEGLPQTPVLSDNVVAGQGYQFRNQKQHFVYIGETGVSAVGGDRRDTVRFDDCVAMLAWPDGCRQLIGFDDRSVQIDPVDYPAEVAALIPQLDARIGPHRTVIMPARDPEKIRSQYHPVSWRTVLFGIAALAVVIWVVVLIVRGQAPWWYVGGIALVIGSFFVFSNRVSHRKHPEHYSAGLTGLPYLPPAENPT